MQYRKYGNTEIELSTLGFGCMRFENPEDIDGSAGTVVHAHNRGITYFDTAPGYCNDKSEIIVGKAVKEMRQSGDPFFLSTKSMKKKGADLRKDLDKSLTRLGVDSIDFFHCWYILTMDDWMSRKKGGAVDEILKARDEGLIKHAAFSTHLPGSDIAKVVGEELFRGVTLGYSAINFPFRTEGIQAADENNMGVVIMNPLGGGTITSGGDAFDFIKVHPGQTILEGALHFLMADSRITSFLVGFRNIDDVDSAVAAVESYKPYGDDDIVRIKERVAGGLNSLCTSCMYCKGCPIDIPVWAYVETVNSIILKTGEEAAGRLKYHWGVDPELFKTCTQCGYCESVCTQKLPIMERFDILANVLDFREKKNE